VTGAGWAGAVYAGFTALFGYPVEDFTVDLSILLLTIIIVGGIRHPLAWLSVR